jgi:CelD/BcsL family acetyltransferase involved in cellulose biosynthesis
VRRARLETDRPDRAGEQIEWVTDPDRLAAISDAWDRLSARDFPPFGDHAWFTAWWDAFGSDGELRACLLWRRDELSAALPMASKRSRFSALTNPHTPSFIAPARDDAALESIVAATFDARPTVLTIDALQASDPLRDALATASERRGRALLEEPAQHSPRVELSGDFERYAAERKSRLRNITKQWTKLTREHAVGFRFACPDDDFDAEVERAFALEAAGWKGRAGTAVLSTLETTRFYTALARAYKARGELRLAWLDVDEAPAAFIFAVQRNRRVYGLKAGYDEDLRRYSPGLLIVLRTIERCFELGLAAYELTGSDEPWKAYFANATLEHVRLRSYGRRPLQLTRYVARRAGKPVAKRIVATVRGGGSSGRR